MKKKFLFFIVSLFLAAGLFFGARFLFARAYGNEMPAALSEHAIVAPSDAGVYVYDDGKLRLVDAVSEVEKAVSFTDPKMIAVGKTLYVADGKTLYSYSPKLEKLSETTTPEEIRTLASHRGALYYGMKDQTVRVANGESTARSTPGYPVRLFAGDDALVVLTISDKGESLKSRLYLFRDGKDDASFGFLGEVMEDAAFSGSHLYLVTNRAYYHFTDARLVEKDEINRLAGTACTDDTLLYLDNTRLVRVSLADGSAETTHLDDVKKLVRAKDLTLLLGKRATVLADDGKILPAREDGVVYGGFSHGDDLYLVTSQGIYRYFSE